jgi:choline dehydrogenase
VTEADYIVVGAGSPGCAIAYRLAEAGHKVLVIEHGGTDAGPFIKMPAALSYPMNMARYDWGYVTEPEPHMGGPRHGLPARQGDRRVVLDQRDDLRARPRLRLRHWAEMGATAGPMPTCCPISGAWSIGTAGGRPVLARHRRPAHITRGRAEKPAVPRLRRGGRGRRATA